MMRQISILLLRGLVLVSIVIVENGLGTALSDERELPTASPSDAVYDPSQLVEISIEMDPHDWMVLRKQHRDFLRGRPPGTPPYNYFKADVEIDGERVESIGVSKKGNLGSSVTTRPSLKLKFDEYDSDREFRGLTRMTLNNNNQDSSRINQFIAYKFFRSGGIPAPRCNLAAVTVNGEYLGIYSNIEPIKKPLLRRYFSRANGNIYEGRRFERKNNRKDPARDDADRLLQAPSIEDENLIAELGKMLDIDAFLTFWAMEGFIGHWDSYSGNNNNFYAYCDPDTGRFTFIPWGADAVFMDPGPFLDGEIPRSVKAQGPIANKLYSIPEGRRMYLKRLREIMEKNWSATEYLNEIDRLEKMISAKIVADRTEFEINLDSARDFIRTREAVVKAELDRGEPAWAPRPQPVFQAGQKGVLSGRFRTRWGRMPIDDRYSRGDVSITELTFQGETITLSEVGVAAGYDKKWVRPDYPMIEIYGLNEDRDKQWIVYLAIDPFNLKLNTPIPVDFFTVFGTLRSSFPEGRDYEDMKKVGWLVGDLVLEEFGDSPGDAVAGSFNLQIR
jgi:spore coat protein CotH